MNVLLSITLASFPVVLRLFVATVRAERRGKRSKLLRLCLIMVATLSILGITGSFMGAILDERTISEVSILGFLLLVIALAISVIEWILITAVWAVWIHWKFPPCHAPSGFPYFIEQRRWLINNSALRFSGRMKISDPEIRKQVERLMAEERENPLPKHPPSVQSEGGWRFNPSSATSVL